MSEENDVRSGLPASEEAERLVCSCVLQAPLELMPVAMGMRPEWFYFERFRLLFEELRGMDMERAPIELASVAQRLRDKQLLEKMGGEGWLMEVEGAAVTPGHFSFYREVVLAKHLLRRVWLTGTDYAQRVAEWGTEDPRQLVEQMEASVFGVLQEGQKAAEAGQARAGAVVMKEAVHEWLEQMEEVSRRKGGILGLPTGITDLDRALHGLDDREGEIMVVAGRPGMGKTALGCTLVENMGVEHGAPGMVFSVEMTRHQLLSRIVLGGAGVDTAKAHTAFFSKEEMQVNIPQQVKRLQGAPVWFDDRSELTTADLRTGVQVAKRQHGIRWIMVDHLHLVKGVQEQSLRDERVRLVEVMQTLQFIKKEFGIAVILMVQMNRDSDRSFGKPPVLADLSGSAAIEQYADHVVFIHRPPYYVPWSRKSEEKQEEWAASIEGHRRSQPDYWSGGDKYPDETYGPEHQDYDEHAVLFVRKNRRGPTPDVWVRFQPELTRFSSRTAKLFSNDPEQRQVGQ
jgi:replicative DNA helicase